MRYALVAAIVILVAAGAYLAFGKETRAPIERSGAYKETMETWRRAFIEMKFEDAYAAFRAALVDRPYTETHELAHIVGEIIYERYGLEGFSLCDDSSEFGCYHGFAGRALFDRGMDAVSALHASCTTSADELKCMHGMGHGILAYLGNDHLDEALEICGTLPQKSPVGGCFGGVFMEYNFRTMQSATGREVRPMAARKSHEPCASEVPVAYRVACYFDLPSWWFSSTEERGLSPERFTVVGKRCDEVSGASERESCFRGIGNLVGPKSGYDAETAKRWCAGMPDALAESQCVDVALGHIREKNERL